MRRLLALVDTRLIFLMQTDQNARDLLSGAVDRKLHGTPTVEAMLSWERPTRMLIC